MLAEMYEILICKCCGNEFGEALILPCDIYCKNCVNKITLNTVETFQNTKFVCFCGEDHLVPKNGFKACSKINNLRSMTNFLRLSKNLSHITACTDQLNFKFSDLNLIKEKFFQQKCKIQFEIDSTIEKIKTFGEIKVQELNQHEKELVDWVNTVSLMKNLEQKMVKYLDKFEDLNKKAIGLNFYAANVLNKFEKRKDMFYKSEAFRDSNNQNLTEEILMQNINELGEKKLRDIKDYLSSCQNSDYLEALKSKEGTNKEIAETANNNNKILESSSPKLTCSLIKELELLSGEIRLEHFNSQRLDQNLAEEILVQNINEFDEMSIRDSKKYLSSWQNTNTLGAFKSKVSKNKEINEAASNNKILESSSPKLTPNLIKELDLLSEEIRLEHLWSKRLENECLTDIGIDEIDLIKSPNLNKSPSSSNEDEFLDEYKLLSSLDLSVTSSKVKYVQIRDIFLNVDLKIKPKFGILENRKLVAVFVDIESKLNITLLNSDLTVFKSMTLFEEKIVNFVLKIYKNRMIFYCSFTEDRCWFILNEQLEVVSQETKWHNISSIAADDEKIVFSLNDEEKIFLYEWDMYYFKKFHWDLKSSKSMESKRNAHSPEGNLVKIELADNNLFCLGGGNMSIGKFCGSFNDYESYTFEFYDKFEMKGDDFCFDFEGNLLTSCTKANKMYRYTKEGHLIQEIQLDSSFFGFLELPYQKIFIFV